MHIRNLIITIVLAQLFGCTEISNRTAPNNELAMNSYCNSQSSICSHPPAVSLNDIFR
jgi:uncharacterized protein YceK